MKLLKLTKAEANHILNLIDANETDDWYFAPKDQYWNRSERIKSKIIDLFVDKKKQV